MNRFIPLERHEHGSAVLAQFGAVLSAIPRLEPLVKTADAVEFEPLPNADLVVDARLSRSAQERARGVPVPDSIAARTTLSSATTIGPTQAFDVTPNDASPTP